MTDKEKYMELMQRYWEAETTPREERALARYVARVDDPEFDGLRGVLGYLSIGREQKAREARSLRLFPLLAAAAAVVAAVAIGFGLRHAGARTDGDLYVCYTYGEKTTDKRQVMNSVESSLSDFFGGSSPVETNLFDMFER